MATNEEEVAPAEPTEEQQFEEKARKTGWTPRNEFPGKPEKWMDAKTWVERGETFIPFLRQSNQSLKGEVSALQQQLAEERRLNQMRDKALAELKEESVQRTTQETETEREALIDQIAEAREANDLRRELRLRDALAEMNERIREAKRAPAPAPVPAQPAVSPEVQAAMKKFAEDNPWFENDQMMAAAAVAAMDQLNRSGQSTGLSIPERFERVGAEVRKRFGVGENPRAREPSRVEGSRTEGSPAAGSGRGFEDLPAEAKRQCDQLAKRFIGKQNGRGEVKYRTLADYRDQYAADYFDSSWGTKVLTQ